MNSRRKIIQSLMLLCSFIVLLSVLVPHHHHSDGSACYVFQLDDSGEGHTHHNDMHTCECNGHNLFFSNHSVSQQIDQDMDLMLHPILFLFEYLNPLADLFHWWQDWEFTPTIYLESLHGVWIVKATGLRAPPACL